MSPEAEELADRIRDLIGFKVGVTEKKMFGGVCFLVNGNMVVAAMGSGDMLMRVGPDHHAEIAARPGYAAMQQGGKEMVGFVLGGYDEISDDDALRESVLFCLDFAKTLPPKAPKAARPPASPRKPPAPRRRAPKAPRPQSS